MPDIDISNPGASQTALEAALRVRVFGGAVTPSDLGRSLAGAVDAQTARNALGLGSGSTMDVGTTGKALAGAADVVSALAALGPVFGGAAPLPAAAGVGMANGNFNTITVPGLYSISGTWANGPTGASNAAYTGVLEVRANAAGTVYQQTLYLNTGAVHQRFGASGPAFQGWYRQDVSRQYSEEFVVASSGVYSKAFPATGNTFGMGLLAAHVVSNPSVLFAYRIGPTSAGVAILAQTGTPVAQALGSSTTLTGTTGASGVVSLAASTADAKLYIENRHTSALRYSLTLFNTNALGGAGDA